ncbi:transposon Ty3-I Gag-Pol polyprotein [Trichonephila clavipes]|nr:transposon Ty3-I Gag-Pol polyprotein [Trichonephila clavipes]
MAVNPSDIVKTMFVTKNGTYAFRRMPFGLSGAAPNFQKAIDIILKPVIGKFVNVYMDDVIISSPSFTQHVKHLKEVFRLLHEARLTLNKDKGVGAILNQEQRPVVFASRTLSAAERNYMVRIYRHRKCDETEIGTGSSDNGILRDKSSGFDRVQRRSNESRDGKKKGKEKPKGRDSNAHHKRLQSETKKGEREESRLTIERKTQQGGPVRSRKGRERNYNSHTSNSEQDQTTRMPDEEVINNGKTRKGEERVQRNPCH